ncbi:protein of unknown function [Lentzea waywayandensis]|uniref:DUF397 domain-containing protein n=1 Tax=Lentzea waywayandensis TaxID=84724 RepID=A0A1I6ES24_9PSEU|nr:DUF397 domain-containing protein [Lentzea waywayandensis]SFR20377.1 protein of unknown function [Lentzea waywayandensis]
MTAWRKSTYSVNGTDCVEVGHGVGVRDSKAPATHLAIGTGTWTAFLAATKADKLAR